MNLTVRELENIGIGVIRTTYLKSTLQGRIYRATVYYDNKDLDLEILYYRSGGSKILGPADENTDELEKYKAFIKSIAPRVSIRNHIIRRFAGAGAVVATIITITNIRSTVSPVGIIYDAIDVIMLVFLLIIYRREVIHERQ